MKSGNHAWRLTRTSGTALVLGVTMQGAFAQSNVTMFGAVDTGIVSARAGGNKLTGMSENGLTSNRFGVQGVEDLGGGLKANFYLESAIGANGLASGTQNGAQGVALDFSSRLAYLGLTGSFGSTTFGRVYTPAYLTLSAYNVGGTVGVGSIQNIVNTGLRGVVAGAPTTVALGLTSFLRASNAITWNSPNWSGFTASAQMNFGERTNASGAEREAGFSLRYAPGPWSVGISYGDQKDNGAAAGVGAVAGGVRIKRWLAGAHVDISAFRLVAGYQRLADNAALRSRARDWWLGLRYVAGAHTLRTEYSRRTTNRASDVGDASQWMAGYIYAFSKRTDAYLTYSRIGNKGNAATGSAYNVIPTGNVTLAYSGAGGQRSSGWQVGLAHRF